MGSLEPPYRPRKPLSAFRGAVLAGCVAGMLFWALKETFGPVSPVTVSFETPNGLVVSRSLIDLETCTPTTLPYHQKWQLVSSTYAQPNDSGSQAPPLVGNSSICFIDTASGEIIRVWARPAGEIQGFNPKGQLVAVEEMYEYVPVGDAAANIRPESSPAVEGPDTPPSKMVTLKTLSSQKIKVRLFDPSTGEEVTRTITSQPFPHGTAHTWAVSADCTTLVMGTLGARSITIETFDMASGQAGTPLTLERGPGLDMDEWPEQMRPIWPTALRLALAPDGRHLAISGHRAAVELFSLPDRNRVAEIQSLVWPGSDEPDPVLKLGAGWTPKGLEFSRDGRHLIVSLQFSLPAYGVRFQADSLWYSLESQRAEEKPLLPASVNRTAWYVDDPRPDPLVRETVYSNNGTTAVVITEVGKSRQLRLFSRDGKALGDRITLPDPGHHAEYSDICMVDEYHVAILLAQAHDTNLLNWIPGLSKEGEPEQPMIYSDYDDVRDEARRWHQHFTVSLLDLRTGRLRKLRSVGILDGTRTVQLAPRSNGLAIFVGTSHNFAADREEPDRLLIWSLDSSRPVWVVPVCLLAGGLAFAMLRKRGA